MTHPTFAGPPEQAPNFFILGAPKCGTTSLADWLNQHPQVWFSPVKEPFYWNTDHEILRRMSTDDYATLFAGAEPEHGARGEGTVWSLHSREAVPNIERACPGARYIVCVRQPADMALSLYGEQRFRGNELLASFEAAWRAQGGRRDRRATLPGVDPANLRYREVCSLGAQVERLLGYVERDRLLFLRLSDIARDAAGTFARVCDFLDVEDAPVDFAFVNAAKERRFPRLHAFQKRLGNWRARHGLGRELGLSRLLQRFDRKPAAKPSMPPGLRAEITSEMADDIRLLQMQSGLDLSAWLSEEGESLGVRPTTIRLSPLERG